VCTNNKLNKQANEHFPVTTDGRKKEERNPPKRPSKETTRNLSTEEKGGVKVWLGGTIQYVPAGSVISLPCFLLLGSIAHPLSYIQQRPSRHRRTGTIKVDVAA
jgi:hypothetical protein